MIQVKFINANEIVELETATNEFLQTVKAEAIKDIKYDFDELVSIVQYEFVEDWKNHMCCDCQYWDDGGDTSVTGICHETGQRRRFNCKSCEHYKDIRG